MRFHENNLDLLRLFAALQVVTLHVFGNMGFASSTFFKTVASVPGVPIFFFISGFLIPRSLEKMQMQGGSPLRDFFQNRFLRLYPALWLCFVLSVVSVYVTGYFGGRDIGVAEFGVWTIAQNSFLQFYNPDFMRDYGVGVLNGSLWTISVELQFYLLTPALVYLCRKSTKRIVILIVVFGAFNLACNSGLLPQSSLAKIIGVSFLPWIYMFLLGYLFSSSERLRNGVLAIPLTVFFVVYIVVYYLAHDSLGVNNSIHPVALFVLCCAVLKAAYVKPTFSNALLGKNDISYGIYIYHMPIINLFLFTGLALAVEVQIALIFGLVFAVATASWFMVERPALAAKRRSMRARTA